MATYRVQHVTHLLNMVQGLRFPLCTFQVRRWKAMLATTEPEKVTCSRCLALMVKRQQKTATT